MQKLVDLEKKKTEELQEQIKKLEMNAKNREDEMARLSLTLSQKQAELTQKDSDMMNQNSQKDLANSKLQELLEKTLNRVTTLESNMQAMTTPVKPAESLKKDPTKPAATPASEVGEPAEDEHESSDEDEDDGWVTTPSGQQVPCCFNYLLMTHKNGVVHDSMISFKYMIRLKPCMAWGPKTIIPLRSTSRPTHLECVVDAFARRLQLASFKLNLPLLNNGGLEGSKGKPWKWRYWNH